MRINKRQLGYVLLIDDDDDSNFFNKRLLKKMKCADKVEEAYNGLEALEILEEGEEFPDLIILDINMYMMNGWEFLERYKKIPYEKRRSCVLIMLTSSINPTDKQRAEKEPCVQRFETKPLSRDRLEEIIEHHFYGIMV